MTSGKEAPLGGHRFDRLAKAMGSGVNRRTVLRGLIGTLATAAGLRMAGVGEGLAQCQTNDPCDTAMVCGEYQDDCGNIVYCCPDPTDTPAITDTPVPNDTPQPTSTDCDVWDNPCSYNLGCGPFMDSCGNMVYCCQTATDTPTDIPPPTDTPTPTNTPVGETPTPVGAPAATIWPLRGKVNSRINFTLAGFPPNAAVTIRWRRVSGAVIPVTTVQTNGLGAASGHFRVPETPGGPNQQVRFVAGNMSDIKLFEVAPRITVLDNPTVRGQLVNVSLRGYTKNETVRVRWKKGLRWVTLATVVTSNTGSKNVYVKVPAWAPDGYNSVRGDGTVFRQQTNAVYVQGGS